MKVLEIFQSINGEGLSSGRLSTFVRFAGCNMNCKWCDTAYSINPSKETVFEMTPEEIAAQCTTDYVTLTGGEPLLQNEDEMLLLLDLLVNKRVEIETNGSVDIRVVDHFSYINMDCKLAEIRNAKYMDVFKSNLLYLTSGDCVKFVVSGVEDMYRVAQILEENTFRNWTPLISVVWNNNEEERKACMQEVIEFMKIHKTEFYEAQFQLQMHKYIWDATKRCV